MTGPHLPRLPARPSDASQTSVLPLHPGHALIPMLPVLAHAGDGGVLWVLRLHLAVIHSGIAGSELGDGLGHRWPGAGQVHVAPFHEDRTARENAGRVLSYGAKSPSGIMWLSDIAFAA
jgi:hypothetical protein